MRWPIEQLFSDVKLLVGLDSAEVRCEKSVLRHAILAFALASWTRIWAKKMLSRTQDPPASFARQLSALRRDLIAATISASSPRLRGSARITEDLAALMAA